MFAISVTVLAAIIVIDLLRPVPPEVRLDQLRQQLSALRAASDSCLATLQLEESRLLASDSRFDSLRNRIEYYENLDPRGVPADSYEAYLKTFNSYNDAIPARTAAGDSLQVHWDTCRSLVEDHNQIADSALGIARELGRLREAPGRRQPVPSREAAAPDSDPAPQR